MPEATFAKRRQTKALRHALTLPKLERLVYSTCSIHDVENELVVKAVLEEAQELGFQLVDPFPSWPRRGLPLLPGHHHLIKVGESTHLSCICVSSLISGDAHVWVDPLQSSAFASHTSLHCCCILVRQGAACWLPQTWYGHVATAVN